MNPQTQRTLRFPHALLLLALGLVVMMLAALAGAGGGSAAAAPLDGPAGGCGPSGTPGPWATSTVGPSARYRTGATTDGTYVYVYGGSTSAATYLSDLWRWDPTGQTWTQLASMPTGKSNIQGSYYDGKIYVPGGYNNSHMAEMAIYDIAGNSWSTGAPEPAIRSGATAAYNGKIYVFGGNPGPSNQTLIYDIAGNSWSTGANMPVAITYGRAIRAGSYMYYVGGITSGTVGTVYRYDPVGDSWATMAPLQTARTSAELMLSPDGTQIYAVNGGDATYFTGVPLAQTVEIYDIAGNSWTYGNPVVTKAAASAGGLAGGKLMIQGGVDGTSYYDQVQVSVLTGGVPCTATPTATAPPTETATATATETSAPPTATATSAPPTATATSVPPTATATGVAATATATVTPCVASFSDVNPADYFYTPVGYLACHGVISGYADGTFRPSNSTTRGQMVKIVVGGFGLTAPPTTPPGGYTFADVPPAHPFFSYIETAAALGIVSGYTCGGPGEACDAFNRPYFRSGADVTRGQLSKIVVNAAGWAVQTPPVATFTDVPPAHTFYSYIETAACHGVISGYADHTFRPGNNATRGQIAKIVYFALGSGASCGPAATPPAAR
ncbi:MAG TPA: S-layer homology domain-containing protein [Chloroflexia bacterium]